MTKRVRNIVIIISLILLIITLFLSSSGKIAGVMILDYKTSDNDRLMTVKVGLISSIGYIRTMREKDDENKKIITFYSTYGFNSHFGAKNEFQFELKPECDEIYFYSGKNEFTLKLRKDKETNEWYEVRY